MSEHIRAGEILTTGYCPFNCRYCYIPKSEQMKKIHERIIRDIKNGAFLLRLEKLYGDKLEHLAFWGTEPTLTLPLLQEKIPLIFKTFPNLKTLDFSTAMMSDPHIIYEFIRALVGRNIRLKIQISLDGPSFITDVNRMAGAAERIPMNLMSLLAMINALNLGKLRVEFRWKATFVVDNMKVLNEDPIKIDEYYQYFEGLKDKFHEINKNKNVTLNHSPPPTVAVPGKYTTEDGRIFAQFVRNTHNRGYMTTYISRLKRIFENERELYKRHAFSCSGGDSNLAVGEQIHICHRSFYLNDDLYIESVMSEESSIGAVDNWDVSLFERGTIDYIRDRYIVDVLDIDDQIRFKYVMRGFHDYWGLQLSTSIALITELAHAGQIDEIYAHDEDLRFLFALFGATALNCPMEALLNTGSIHLQVVSLLRFFGNGAFQELWRKTKNELSRTK